MVAVHARRLGMWAEAALAFLAGTATFALVAVAVIALDTDVLEWLLALALVFAIAAVARRPGVAYAVPVAMATVHAYDWYYLPPTHGHEFPDAENLWGLLVYLALGVLIGQITSRAGHRAAVSDAARTELTEEQASLRRVATLVAQGVSPSEAFASVARELGHLLAVDATHVGRFEPDDTVVGVANWSRHGDHFPAGTRVSLEGESVSAQVHRTGRPARVDSYDDMEGSIAAVVQARGVRTSVGAPIVVNGRLWGVAIASSKSSEPLPPGTESRIGAFTELVGTAIANAEAQVELSRLAEEQAALRRVATLVAKDSSAAELFAQVAAETGHALAGLECGLVRFEPPDAAVVVAASGSRVSAQIPVGSRIPLDAAGVIASAIHSGGVVRVDDYAALSAEVAEGARDRGVSSAVACPVEVRGQTWGAMVVVSFGAAPCPPDTETRLAQFADLVATAVANAQARAEVERLAEQQAALRRVATLVAQGAETADVFAAVTEQVAHLFAAVAPSLVPSVIKFDPGPEFVLVGAAAPMPGLPMGSRWAEKELYVSTRVRRSGRSARVEEEDLAALGGPDAELLRHQGFLHQVGSPIVVEGDLWGAVTINATEPLPPDADDRLEKFTELIATAIANTESRARADRLAEEQAARRRIATLIAEEAAPRKVFDRVTEEVARLLGGAGTSLWRDEGDGTATAVAVSGFDTPVGTRLPTDGDGVISTVLRERRPHWIAPYEGRAGAIVERGRALGIHSAIGCPILVGERVWGALGAARAEGEPFPPGTERQLARFADLVATGVANAEARSEVQRLAAEQAALRRVATLVAEGAVPTTVFDAVAGEMESLLDADQVALNRFEPGDEILVLAHRGLDTARTPVGTRVSVAGKSATAKVRRTGRPARMEGYAGAPGPLAELARDTGLRSSVSAPIVVEGRLWGLITASWKREDPPPADTEERMAQFAELLDTAIANADTRDQLDASRARLVTADDEARRRVVRDLHDGAQQRLVHTIVTLTLAKQALGDDGGKAGALVNEALEQAKRSNDELRELAHGILPSALTHGGLSAAVDSVVTRIELPVRVDVPCERFPAEIEASAYFFVAEALTNVAKHAQARRADVRASVDDRMLRVEVRDDGVGGADPAGHGLVGMSDRVSALGGRLDIDSPPGAGTLLTASLPLTAA